MRLLFAAMALTFFVQTPSNAQNCETLSVRDAAGRVIASKQICVDANGAWVDPATVNAISEPVVRTFTPEAPPQPEIIYEAEVLPQPVQAIEQPAIAVQIAPSQQAAPAIVAPLSVVEEFLPAAEISPAPLSSPPTQNAWQPTTGKAKRDQLYAKLGLVCEARSAQFCSGGNCSGLCTGQLGWCDNKTGEIHASLEAIERIYCRKKKRR